MPRKSSPDKWVNLFRTKSDSSIAIYLLVVLLVGAYGVSRIDNDDPIFEQVRKSATANRDIFEIINMAGSIEVKLMEDAKEAIREKKRLRLEKWTLGHIRKLLSFVHDRSMKKRHLEEVDDFDDIKSKRLRIDDMMMIQKQDEEFMNDDDDDDANQIQEADARVDKANASDKEERIIIDDIYESGYLHCKSYGNTSPMDLFNRLTLESNAPMSRYCLRYSTSAHLKKAMFVRTKIIEEMKNDIDDVFLMRKEDSGDDIWFVVIVGHDRYAHLLDKNNIRLVGTANSIRTSFPDSNRIHLHLRFYGVFCPVPKNLLVKSDPPLTIDASLQSQFRDVLENHHSATAIALIENTVCVFVRFNGFIHVSEDGSSPNIPSEIGGFKVKQVEGWCMRLNSFDEINMPTNGKYSKSKRELRPGYSIGAVDNPVTGTIGAIFVSDDNTKFGITNSHVTGEKLSTVVNHPSMHDVQYLEIDDIRERSVGRVISGTIDDYTDASLIEVLTVVDYRLPSYINGSVVTYNPRILEHDDYMRAVRNAVSIGRSSGDIFVDTVSYTGMVKLDIVYIEGRASEIWMRPGRSGQSGHLFVDQIFGVAVSNNLTTDIFGIKTWNSVTKGDSGSCLWNVPDGDTVATPFALLHSGILVEGGKFIGVYSRLSMTIDTLMNSCFKLKTEEGTSWGRRLQRFLLRK